MQINRTKIQIIMKGRLYIYCYYLLLGLVYVDKQDNNLDNDEGSLIYLLLLFVVGNFKYIEIIGQPRHGMVLTK